MGPTWWDERRFGIFVEAGVATVPAWSPIGESVEWYRSHLGEDVGDTGPHPHPMVEVLAHHRDRWGHIERFDDFAPLLTFHDFDAEDWARLVADAGAGYSVLVTRHHDGWSWWDAPNTARTLLTTGPRRNVVAEYAAACERNDIVFGTSCSLLDWSDARCPDAAWVADVLRPQVLDLVERYGSHVVWADRPLHHEHDAPVTDELLDEVAAIDPTVLFNDGWGTRDNDRGAGRPLIHTFEYDPPDDIVVAPWVLRRPVATSSIHNRAERTEHHLSGVEIVSLLTHVVAKGGHLLLDVGPSADGTISDLQRAPLLEAGRWIRHHRRLIDASTPWSCWGDEDVRFLQLDGRVLAVDIGGRGRFGPLIPTVGRVESVELDGAPIAFHQDHDGLHLDIGRPPFDRRGRGARDVSDICVYELRVAELERPDSLFAPEPRQPIELAPFLRDVSPGDIVQLGDGVYTGPTVVPPGVILRGLGGMRTTIRGGGTTAVVLERNARLEHVGVADGPHPSSDSPGATIELVGPYATVLGCRIEGHVVVRADDTTVRATSASGVVSDGGQRLTVSRCQFRGDRRDIGIHLVGGSGHEIDSCEFVGHLCAIRASNTTGTIIRGNNVTARWWGIHVAQTEGAHVYGNFIDHTMRGIDIDGGAQAVIDGNVVCDGDSGCVVAWGASDCQVSGNRWERCRIGILAWEAMTLHAHDNEAIDLHEPDAAHATGP